MKIRSIYQVDDSYDLFTDVAGASCLIALMTLNHSQVASCIAILVSLLAYGIRAVRSRTGQPKKIGFWFHLVGLVSTTTAMYLSLHEPFHSTLLTVFSGTATSLAALTWVTSIIAPCLPSPRTIVATLLLPSCLVLALATLREPWSG